MTDSKHFLTSVTFWGLLLTLAAPLLKRAGIELPGDTAGMANDIAQLVGAALALWGRWRADQPLHLVGAPLRDEQPGQSQRGYTVLAILPALILIALLTACVTPKSPAQAVYQAQGSYASALTVAVAYKQLPRCAPLAPVICSEPAIVSKLQVADDVAFSALSSAQAIAREPGAGLSAQTAITAAEAAVSAFLAITSGLQIR